MCGIVGIFNFNKEPVAHHQIKAMTDIIAHRGPDGEGQWIDKNVGIGHRRLSIIDLSSAGNQPMQSSNGRYTLTYNGEIYNFKELRTELQACGYQFHSSTDTEVVLYAYSEWKEKCIEKFNGMFAFAIWDKESQNLFLARDRYGIKPLYYHIHPKGVVFASEIKAILKSGVYHPALDEEGLVEYLTFQNFFTDHTLFKDVKILLPGHFANISALGKFTSQQYWDFSFSSNLQISEEEAIIETDRLFKQAVNRQLISDVPVNAYLSGGIDSGAITMIAKNHLPHLRNFTVGFDLNSASGLELSFDERQNAEYMSYVAQTEHYEMVLKAGDMERCMHDYVYHLEEPRVGQSYPNYYAAKLASKFGKVVLSGCGGDELFGGYPWRYFYSDTPVSKDDFINQYYTKWQRLFDSNTLSHLLEPMRNSNIYEHPKEIFSNIFNRFSADTFKENECLNLSLYLESKTFLHGLLVVEDKLSMAHGLETRVPFLDNDLVDFATSIPNTMKVIRKKYEANENDLKSKVKAHSNGKMILRKAFRKLLGEKISDNKKQGFSSPDASWFRGESIDYVNVEFQELPDYINKIVAKDILKQHIEGSKNNRLLIWSLLYLKKFGERYL